MQDDSFPRKVGVKQILITSHHGPYLNCRVDWLTDTFTLSLEPKIAMLEQTAFTSNGFPSWGISSQCLVQSIFN